MNKEELNKLKEQILEKELERLLTLDEAAQIMGVSKSTLRRLDNTSVIRSYRIGTGKHRRFKKKDLLDYLEKNSSMPAS
jgi:excisionase family DNA binding protein